MAPAASSTASPSSSTSSDQSTIVALVLAAAAFLISFLQMLVQYLTSSPTRDKCSQGAIGGWHTYAKTRWDFFNYRLRVLYPVVNLDCVKILQSRRTAWEQIEDD